jgi:hypothetical protein
VLPVGGYTVDKKVVDKLIDYLEASAGQGGGVGYAASEGQRGMGNIGRTAGAWLGAQSLGLRDREFVKKMASYTEENIANIMGGHASLMQHILLAGVAAKALGADAETDKVGFADLTAAPSSAATCSHSTLRWG